MLKQEIIRWREGERQGEIPVRIIYSGRRTLGLEIKGDGQVIARVPNRISDRAVRQFLGEREQWIAEKWRLVMERAKKERNRPRHDYEEDLGLEILYRKRAKEQLEQRCAYFAGIMGVDYNRITIRAAKTRWGSCSSGGNLNFHWKLILMPPEILDYVAVHELAHRKEMNHSSRFWAEVRAVLPDYEDRRRWLREFGGQV